MLLRGIMASGQSYPIQILSGEVLIEALEQPTKLAELVKKIEEIKEEEARKLLGKTTKSGFRKIHEQITSAIDRAAEILVPRPGKKIDERDIDNVYFILAQRLIFVRYQVVRGQVSEFLAKSVAEMIKHLLKVLDEVKEKKNQESIVRLTRTLESMRTMMDALMVLVYRFAR